MTHLVAKEPHAISPVSPLHFEHHLVFQFLQPGMSQEERDPYHGLAVGKRGLHVQLFGRFQRTSPLSVRPYRTLDHRSDFRPSSWKMGYLRPDRGHEFILPPGGRTVGLSSPDGLAHRLRRYTDKYAPDAVLEIEGTHTRPPVTVHVRPLV